MPQECCRARTNEWNGLSLYCLGSLLISTSGSSVAAPRTRLQHPERAATSHDTLDPPKKRSRIAATDKLKTRLCLRNLHLLFAWSRWANSLSNVAVLARNGCCAWRWIWAWRSATRCRRNRPAAEMNRLEGVGDIEVSVWLPRTRPKGFQLVHIQTLNALQDLPASTNSVARNRLAKLQSQLPTSPAELANSIAQAKLAVQPRPSVTTPDSSRQGSSLIGVRLDAST